MTATLAPADTKAHAKAEAAAARLRAAGWDAEVEVSAPEGPITGLYVAVVARRGSGDYLAVGWRTETAEGRRRTTSFAYGHRRYGLLGSTTKYRTSRDAAYGLLAACQD